MRSYIECIDVSASINMYPVLEKVNIKIEKGKVYAVIGENGSGKTTLARILCGFHQVCKGKIIIDDNEVKHYSPEAALRLGIHMIHQEHNLLSELSVTENVHLHIIKNNVLKFINYNKMRKDTKAIFDWIGIPVDVDKKVKHLKYFEREMVELAKAIICKPDVLILDEPTCSMIDINTQTYIDAIRRLNQQGMTLIIISHRISLINQLSDKIFIVKDKTICHFEQEGLSEESLFERLAKDSSHRRYPKVHCIKEDVLFEIRNLSSESGSIKDINLTVRKGEIVGVTGLYGAGKSSIGNTIFGFEAYLKGDMFLNGEQISMGSSKTCIKKGIGYIHENIKQSLVQEQSVEDNIILNNLQKFKHQHIFKKEIKEKTDAYIKSMNLKKYKDKPSVSSYSVGSQQKIVFAKWLFADINVLIIDEPTKYVDIISKVDLYNLMNHMVKKEKGILLLSSDLDELIGMCDTILVMYEGRIVKKLSAKRATYKDVLYYSMGK